MGSSVHRAHEGGLGVSERSQAGRDRGIPGFNDEKQKTKTKNGAHGYFDVAARNCGIVNVPLVGRSFAQS
jgi:hypothetical protein